MEGNSRLISLERPTHVLSPFSFCALIRQLAFASSPFCTFVGSWGSILMYNSKVTGTLASNQQTVLFFSKSCSWRLNFLSLVLYFAFSDFPFASLSAPNLCIYLGCKTFSFLHIPFGPDKMLLKPAVSPSDTCPKRLHLVVILSCGQLE